MNVAADPTRHFEVDPVALLAAFRRGRAGEERLIGYFHTHPRGPARPSPTDLALAPDDGGWWLIASAHELRLWRLEEGRFVEHPIEFENCVSLDTDAL